jgi:glucose-1-phosphate thymidylyltransferase
VSGLSEFVGILPAAGLGARLRPFAYPKELLPIAFTRESGRLQPMLAIEYSLEAMRLAKISKCFVVIADWKTEIMRLLGSGERAGLDLAYLHREVPRGLADAVASGYPWFGDSHVALSLPDSIYHPRDAMAQVKSAICETGADLVLGVFPVSNPEEFGPVRISSHGKVLEVFEKPSSREIFNTWGIAVWSPRFSRMLNDLVRTGPLQDSSIGLAFDSAVRQGLQVYAVFFQDGSYIDVGKPENIASLVLPPEPPTR